MAKPISVSQEDKDLILSGLEGLEASCMRLANRNGQLKFAVDGYRAQALKVNTLRSRVFLWDTGTG